MAKVFLYSDESGSKGYADRGEAYPGEVGVFAGILVPESEIGKVKPAFDSIAQKYAPSSGKLHIADLDTDQQQALREELYAAIRQYWLPCFWYAIHVEGFHQFHMDQQLALQQSAAAIKAARGDAEPRVKRGSPRVDVPSMHVALFSGLYSHLVAFLLERKQNRVDVEIRTDQVDTPIVKQFEQVAKELLNDDPEVIKTKGFDTLTKQVVKGSITTSVQWPDELKISPVVKGLSIETVPDSDGLVLAADVLANSLLYLFKNRDAVELYAPLNRQTAIASHPLAQRLDAFYNWGSDDLVGDRLYRHPLAK
ncbi:hypothetical protein CY652_10105 [Burkholderia sp. WAC0059]|uniref:hypothetical protein n=1 Tax=Burkholderia sp. WAC0059 TaxID=2066022 RepID=UPI000C7EFFA8|nr:hypothetical protein [Burkholderia sp. WAC0059]PLZ02470.1 hypothetical protein CY652_10105 [Burkholderia sp. WAC0059]